MVARILIVNEYKTDLSDLSNDLQGLYNLVLFSKSMEDSLRIVGTQSIDVVFIVLQPEKTKLFSDFFAVMRQLCGVIPIVGIFEGDVALLHKYIDLYLDDCINKNISKIALARKINVLIQMKNLFDDNLLNSMYFLEKRSQKMVTIFHDNLGFLHDSVLSKTSVIQLKSWPVIDDISDADLFMINAANSKANECCANLRLRRINKYKPIVLTYTKESKQKAKLALEMNLGCTDIISMSMDPIIMTCKLNSLMKYKKMYESFSSKLKKSIYLSAIDSTTGVYNRAFFEDYIQNQGKDFHNSAILLIDVDKFKSVNDKHGHSFADSMLKYVSSTIKRYIRSSDVIARYGGDEFVIFMDSVSKKTAEEVAFRIQKTVESATFRNTNCTVSIGVCCIDIPGKLGIHDAISVADKFMYIAKQNGGNSVRVCA